MNLLYIHLNVSIQTWLTLTIYNTLSLQQPLHMCGMLPVEQTAQHTRAFILVFAPYWRLLFTLQQVLSRLHMALCALYTDTCRWRSQIGWQRARLHFSPLDNTMATLNHQINTETLLLINDVLM